VNMTSERVLRLSTLMFDWLQSKGVDAYLTVGHDYHNDYVLYIENRRVGWIDDDAVEFECCHSPDGHICGGRWKAADPDFFDKVWEHLKQRSINVDVPSQASVSQM
jgi:hypothetical protein